MQGITRWVLIFDAERFSQKNCAHRRGLLTAFSNFTLGGAAGLNVDFPDQLEPISLFVFFNSSLERRPAARRLVFAAGGTSSLD
jgi:hypothetical protein